MVWSPEFKSVEGLQLRVDGCRASGLVSVTVLREASSSQNHCWLAPAILRNTPPAPGLEPGSHGRGPPEILAWLFLKRFDPSHLGKVF